MMSTAQMVSKVTGMLEGIPGSKQIFEDLKNGKVDPQEAAKRLLGVVTEAGQAESLSKVYGEFQNSLGEENPRVWMDHSNGTRIVNPVMVSAIIERASLDGDVPEFRTGPIPEGGSPAVPVITFSLDSVKIGMQLEIASNSVKSQIKELADLHRNLLESANEHILRNPEEATTIANSIPAAPTGIKGYEEGKRAEPLEVRDIEPLELAAIGESDRSKYTHKVLSTTQGRVSSAFSIGANLVIALEEMGVKVSPTELPEFKRSHWEINCWGPEEVNPNWNPVSIVFKKWCALVKEECKEGDTISVKVTPISGVSDRKFGWTLTLGKQEK